MHKILLETPVENKDVFEELQKEIGTDARFQKRSNFDGDQLIKLIIENGPAYLTLIMKVVATLRDKKKNITLTNDNGEKSLNPSDDDVRKLVERRKPHE